MDGKIALEEHYATEGLVDTAENFLPGAKCLTCAPACSTSMTCACGKWTVTVSR